MNKMKELKINLEKQLINLNDVESRELIANLLTEHGVKFDCVDNEFIPLYFRVIDGDIYRGITKFVISTTADYVEDEGQFVFTFDKFIRTSQIKNLI